MIDQYSYHISRIIKVLVYIEEHLDGELKLEKLAEIARISPYYFHRIFRAYMDETVGAYIKRMRMYRAADRLQYSDSPITDIALDIGYETPSSFTKVFNQVMGKSPTRYRKMMQPIVKKIIERTTQETQMKPEFIHRDEEKVLFVRRTGDYNEIPRQAFEALHVFLQEKGISREGVRAYYSMALDDPSIATRSKCRFDACVALQHPIPPQGEVGEKTLPGKRFACFIHRGSYEGIENAFLEIFRGWYPNSNEKLADALAFCEHLELSNPDVPFEERITKLYIPLEK